MYENTPDNNWLYPGDIICDLKLPNLKKDAFQMVSKNDGQEYSVRLMMTNKYFVYLSHECDYNDSKRQFFLLTPMLHIDQNLRRSKENLDRIISSNDIRLHPHYLNQFYFERRFFIHFSRKDGSFRIELSYLTPYFKNRKPATDYNKPNRIDSCFS